MQSSIFALDMKDTIIQLTLQPIYLSLYKDDVILAGKIDTHVPSIDK